MFSASMQYLTIYFCQVIRIVPLIFCFNLKEEQHKNKLAFRSLLFESAVHACKFKANSHGRRCDSSTLEFYIHLNAI